MIVKKVLIDVNNLVHPNVAKERVGRDSRRADETAQLSSAGIHDIRNIGLWSMSVSFFFFFFFLKRMDSLPHNHVDVVHHRFHSLLHGLVAREMTTVFFLSQDMISGPFLSKTGF